MSFTTKILLNTAQLCLTALKQGLTQNFQRLTTTQPMITPKIYFEKNRVSCSMIKQIYFLLSDQVSASFADQ